MHRYAETLLETLLEVHLAPRGDAHDVVDDAPDGIDDRRHPDPDALHPGCHQLLDERSDVPEHLLFGTVGPAGFRQQTHDASFVHQSDTNVRAAQIHTDPHRSTEISVILPSSKRA